MKGWWNGPEIILWLVIVTPVHAHLYRLHNFRSSSLLAENHFKTVTRENWHGGMACLIYIQSALTGSLKIWISDLYLVTIFCFGKERRQVKRFVLTEDNGILPRPWASLTKTDQSNEPHILLHCLSVFFSRRPHNNLIVEPWTYQGLGDLSKRRTEQSYLTDHPAIDKQFRRKFCWEVFRPPGFYKFSNYT